MAFAAEPEAIEKARDLALKKNRVEAAATLRRALVESNTSAKARTKLTEALNQISNLFFTDKGQKVFESGQATMWDAPDLALARFRESLALEDQNLQVLNGVARVQILKQDCDGAIQTLQAARKLNPFYAESAVLEMRALVCKNNFEAFREKAKSAPVMDKWQEQFVQYLHAIDSHQQKSYKKSSDTLSKLASEQPQFPEPHWVQAKISAELGKDNEDSLQKYISLCKAVTARERKRFALEPRMCTNLKEAEDELAKKRVP